MGATTGFAQDSTPAKATSGNWFLYEGSARAINHWDPEQSDASTLAFPTGDVKSENLDVQFIPGNVLCWTLGHAPTSGGPEIGWFSGAQLIGKVRLDGGRFELIDIFTVPGFEHLADTPALAKQLVEKLDATRAETVFIDTLMDAVKRTRAEACSMASTPSSTRKGTTSRFTEPPFTSSATRIRRIRS